MPDEPLEPTNAAMHSIPTVDERTIFSKQYRFPPAHKEEITQQVNGLLKNKIIKPSQSPYNTPVFIVPKKLDSHGQRKWRMVLDFTKLNEKRIILTIDASGCAIGGILPQGKIGQDKLIAYTSRTLSDSEIKFDTYKKEALAVVNSVQHFRLYQI